MSEHRVSPDKNVEQYVEQETGQPERLVTPLENCTALSDKIGKDVVKLMQELARIKV